MTTNDHTDLNTHRQKQATRFARLAGDAMILAAGLALALPLILPFA